MARQKLEGACWRWSHAHCRHWRRGHTPLVHKLNLQLEPATSSGVILPETGQFLLLCSLQLWQQLQHCRQTRASVPLFFIHFTSVLRKQFAVNDTFLREANSYKRVLALRNSWQVHLEKWPLKRSVCVSLGCAVDKAGLTASFKCMLIKDHYIYIYIMQQHAYADSAPR